MPDDPRVTVTLLDRTDRSVKTVLSEARGKQWQEVLNDTGFGKCTLQNDDDDLALVGYGDFLQFEIDGVIRFVSIVEQMVRVDIAPAEEVDEATEISGRGALALLEDGLVEPTTITTSVTSVPFADARIFNFAEFDVISSDVGGGVTAPYDWGDRFSAGPFYTGYPQDFPPVFSHWVGPQAPDGSGNNPPGDWYFFAIWSGLPDGLFRLYFGYDDGIDVWVDDVPILNNSGGNTIGITKTVDFVLNGSYLHYLAIRVSNLFGGPTGFTAALCSLNPDGSANVEYWATDGTNNLQWVTPYPPAPPGISPGDIVRNLIEVDNGTGTGAVTAFDLITLGFTAFVDSNGVAWAERPNPSFQIGTDLLTAVKTLAESYFDVWFDPVTFTLNLYQTFGSASPASFTEAVDITALQHTGQF